MLAMAPGMEQRWFQREAGETEAQMDARVHHLLGWDSCEPEAI